MDYIFRGASYPTRRKPFKFWAVVDIIETKKGKKKVEVCFSNNISVIVNFFILCRLIINTIQYFITGKKTYFLFSEDSTAQQEDI